MILKPPGSTLDKEIGSLLHDGHSRFFLQLSEASTIGMVGPWEKFVSPHSDKEKFLKNISCWDNFQKFLSLTPVFTELKSTKLIKQINPNISGNLRSIEPSTESFFETLTLLYLQVFSCYLIVPPHFDTSKDFM